MSIFLVCCAVIVSVSEHSRTKIVFTVDFFLFFLNYHQFFIKSCVVGIYQKCLAEEAIILIDSMSSREILKIAQKIFQYAFRYTNPQFPLLVTLVRMQTCLCNIQRF